MAQIFVPLAWQCLQGVFDKTRCVIGQQWRYAYVSIMRIAFIITGLSTGGAETMLLKVLERLDRNRFDPYVISLTTIGEVGAQIAALGIPVDAVGLKRGLPGPGGLFRLVGMLKRLKPDVVHTWMYHADLLGGFAARLAGVSAVGWCIRNSTLDRKTTNWKTRAVVNLCAAVSGWVPKNILSCSEAARAIHVALGYEAKKFTIVPNGFDLEKFHPDADRRRAMRSALGIETDAPIVGLIGRFDPQKNHAGFFEVARLLHGRIPMIHFVLAGQGVDKNNAALEDWTTQAGVVSNTRLLGLREDIPQLFTAMDVLVSSSSYGEAFPNVLGEAMACGVPCAVTDVGDSAYIVGDTGRVVAANDMVGLAKAVEELIDLPVADKITLGERARARVATHFEIGAIVRQYECFYGSLCRGGR
jgi:glycosyltransferase involved in cell wall biosynthesis